jgi:hypothetical protein
LSEICQHFAKKNCQNSVNFFDKTCQNFENNCQNFVENLVRIFCQNFVTIFFINIGTKAQLIYFCNNVQKGPGQSTAEKPEKRNKQLQK